MSLKQTSISIVINKNPLRFSNTNVFECPDSSLDPDWLSWHGVYFINKSLEDIITGFRLLSEYIVHLTLKKIQLQ